jgi:hypothetical protein
MLVGLARAADAGPSAAFANHRWRVDMNTDKPLDRARYIMIRVVSEKIPMAQNWPVADEYRGWIERVSDEEFRAYLRRLSQLTQHLADQEAPKETGVFIAAKAYPLSEAPAREHLSRIGGEATAYYALALWRSLQVEDERSKLRK